jgi:hypothetical protein
MFFIKIKKILGYRRAKAARVQREIDYIKNLLEEARRLMSKGETKEAKCRRIWTAKKVMRLTKIEGISFEKVGTDTEEIRKLTDYYASNQAKRVAKNSQ